MATGGTCNGDFIVNGNLRVSGLVTPTRTRAQILSQVDLAQFAIPWTAWRIWDNIIAPLGATAVSADDLIMVGGTWATDPPSIQSSDFGGTTCLQYARAQIVLPWEYVDGQTVTLRFHAGMITTVADTTCTLDCVAFESDEELGLSADICATAAQSIKSLTLADIDFTITPTALAAGSLLDVRIAIAGEDAGNLGVMAAIIGGAKLLCDVR